MSRFVCRFAVGRDGLAYSSVWRVWTAKNKPDLYIAVARLGGELKATVHAPHPPHTGWKRHFGFHYDAASFIAQQAKQAGGPHKVQWTGHQIAPDMTLEYRVIIRGTSLEKDGAPVANNVVLVPIPSPNETGLRDRHRGCQDHRRRHRRIVIRQQLKRCPRMWRSGAQ
jgi:hypothetical protein